MQVALIKYKDRKRSDKWQAPLVEEEQILALTAQIGNLQKAKNDGMNADKVTKPNAKKKPKTDRYAEKYAWKLVAPTRGEQTTKKVGRG